MTKKDKKNSFDKDSTNEKKLKTYSISFFENNVHYIFLIMSLFFGILFAYKTPPFMAPDEQVHFFKAYYLAETADPLPDVVNKEVNANLPASIDSLQNNIFANHRFNQNLKISKSAFKKELNRKLNPKVTAPITLMHTCNYSPFPYIPQIIGAKIAQIFELGPIQSLRSCRLSNTIICTFIIALAILIIPVFKWGIFLFFMTPICVSQRSMSSQDGMINALSILIVSLVLYQIFSDNKVSNKKIILFIILSSVLAICKQVYVLIPLVCFAIPSSKFNSIKHKMLFLTILIISMCVSFYFWNLGIQKYSNAITLNGFNGGIIQILTNPLEFLAKAFTTIKYLGNFYYLSYIGILGWLDIILPTYIYTLYPIFIVLILVMGENKINKNFTFFQRLVFFIIPIATFLLLLLAFYILTNSPEIQIINDIQGRYLIPFGFLFGIVFIVKQRNITILLKNIFYSVLIIFICISLYQSTNIVWARYFNQ